MPFQSSPNRRTRSRQPRAGLASGSGRVVAAAVRALGVVLCLALTRGVDAQGHPTFAAPTARPARTTGGRAATAALTERRNVTRFAMTSSARGSLQALWRSSVQANEERVACLGGERGDDGVVRITRVYHLVPKAADSANASAGPSLATCRPPRWFGTVHTHIITNPAGEPYVAFSGPDRDVMSRWQQAWRDEGVFCLLYTHASAHCVSGRVAASALTYGPPSSGPRAPRMIASQR